MLAVLALRRDGVADDHLHGAGVEGLAFLRKDPATAVDGHGQDGQALFHGHDEAALLERPDAAVRRTGAFREEQDADARRQAVQALVDACDGPGRIGPVSENMLKGGLTMSELERYRQFGQKIEAFLRPASFPLAIKFIKTEEEIPPGAKRPAADFRHQNFICQNFKIARTYGWTLAVTEKDCNCKIARTVYAWDPLTPEARRFAIQFTVGLYSRNAATSDKWTDTLNILGENWAGMVISPLARTKAVPDVIQIYGLPAQIMRLVQGYLYMEGGTMPFTSSGRAGSCHEGVVKTLQLDAPQVVLLGNGDRVWGGAEDSEILFSAPRSKLGLLVEGLEATHQAGLRYPIPKYMNYSPGFQNEFEQRAIERAGGTLVKER